MRDWKDIAAAAEEARRNAKYGERQEAMSRFAPGVHVDIVRRTIRVSDFLNEVTKKNPKLAQNLRSQQFYHLQVLAQWAVLDLDAAIRAARTMLKEKSSVRTLKASLEAFRRRERGASRINWLAPTQPLLTAVGQLLGGNLSDPVIRPTVLGGRLVDMTLKLDRDGAPPGKVAVLHVGPFSRSQSYVDRMQSVLLNAWAMAWAFDDVVLVLPEEAPMEAYRRWLIDAQGELGSAPTAGPRVHLLTMEASFHDPNRTEERKGDRGHHRLPAEATRTARRSG